MAIRFKCTQHDIYLLHAYTEPNDIDANAYQRVKRLSRNYKSANRRYNFYEKCRLRMILQDVKYADKFNRDFDCANPCKPLKK